jgi:4-amino-4-deoxy-L-arabinose transferase-like glycosyltransferase
MGSKILHLTVGFFLRLYRLAELFNYNHDQDLAGWIIKDVLVNHHFRLIGQLTSTAGVFIGPLFYYLLIPFYLVFKMDPIGGTYLMTILGVVAVWSCYFVFSRIFNTKVGLISALIYAVSPYTIFNDREVVPTMPLMLWSIWFFYSAHLVIKGDQKRGFLIAAVLIALIWHINFGLVVLLPIYLIALLISKKKINVKALLISAVLLIILSTPLLFFETRHSFSQTKAVISSMVKNQGDVLVGGGKVAKVFDVFIKDVADLLWGYPAGIPRPLAFWIVLSASLFIYVRGKIKNEDFYIMVLWLLFTAAFFTLYSKPISEYYLNSITIVWIALCALIINYLLEDKKLKFLGYLLSILFVALSLYRFLSYPINRSGYIERREVVKYIKTDAKKHEYPCVAVSYITNPGYELGYRYFFWMEQMHVNSASSGSPVYTIVFPLSKVVGVDEIFGALGVINPDYSKYNKKVVEKSCGGANSNLTDPMFGYVE